MWGILQKVWSNLVYSESSDEWNHLPEKNDILSAMTERFIAAPPIRDARNALFNVKKNIPRHILDEILEKSWEISPLDTLKIVFYLRDCRGGKGYRDVFYRAMEYIGKRDINILKSNLGLIPYFGYFGDLLVFFGTPVEENMIDVYTKQLERDLYNLQQGTVTDISLAAKYSPSEGGFYDKNFNAVVKFAKALGIKASHKATYRKTYIAPLRAALDSRGSSNTTIVERKMSSNEWDDIVFEKVPNLALKRYKKAWKRHSRNDFAKIEEQFRTKIVKPRIKYNSAKTVEDVIGNFGQYCLIKLHREWEPTLRV